MSFVQINNKKKNKILIKTSWEKNVCFCFSQNDEYSSLKKRKIIEFAISELKFKLHTNNKIRWLKFS